MRFGRLAWVVAVLMAVGCTKSSAPKDPDREGEAVGHHEAPPDGGVTIIPGTPVQEGCPPQCPTTPTTGFHRTAAANPIPAENEKAGDPAWRSGRQSYDHQLEVYASIDSVEAGDTVAVKVSTDALDNGQPWQVTATVYRLGWYGGAGARVVWSGGPFAASPQPACPRDPSTSLVECHWSDTFTFPVGKDWVSGMYLVKVVRADGFMRFTPFVVRDRRAAELLFQAAFNTYQAYNPWGDEDLYYDGSATMPLGRAYQVSYDRPFAADDGSGLVLRWELPMVELLEREGYDVSYVTNMDFSRFTPLLDGIGALVISGHDEYWTQDERDQVDAAVAAGVSVTHFGANGGYWKVRMLSDSSGHPLRTIACYKNEPDKDPQPGSTVRFRDDPNPEPEDALWGSMYEDWQLIGYPLIVSDPGSWVFAGTGLAKGTMLHGLMGYEYDRTFDDGFTPSGVEHPFTSPAVTAEGFPSRSDVTVRTLPTGNIVFSAGSIYWSLGLVRGSELYDARLERVTLNVIERALAHRRPERTLPAVTGPTQALPAPVGCWASAVADYAGAPGDPANVDGPASTARFDGPTGIAVDAQGRVFVADAVGNRIRLIDSDEAHTVTTIAGTGALGLRDGDGASAMFRRPDGIAVGGDGAIYVTDSDNHAIRRISTAPPYTVTLFAGGPRVAGFADGPALQARFNRPTAIVADASGNLFVADQGNNRIRKIDLATGIVSTVAGSGVTGYADASQGTGAAFNNPSAIAVAPTGELYVFDAGNQKLRRVSADPAHAVTTIAGTDSPGFEDGPGDQARFGAQMGMVLTQQGDLILADTANFRLRRITPGTDASTTRVCTFAGSGFAGTATGSGEAAEITAPTGLAQLADGRLLVVDSFNNVLRAITR